MFRSLSALAFLTILLGLPVWVGAQCPTGTIGVYFDPAGTTQSTTPVQHQDLALYVILFVEGPAGGAAWKLQVSSPQYEGPLVGPEGPDCQPPWCTYQDPPFWHVGTHSDAALVLGDPFLGGVRQGFGRCISGFFGNPILLATVILRPWAEILGSIEVDITVVGEDNDGLVYADCAAHLCHSVVGLTSHLAPTVVSRDVGSWGALKALYR
jgi:hypothetical protein